VVERHHNAQGRAQSARPWDALAGRSRRSAGIERIRAGEPRVVVLEKTPMPGTKMNAELLLQGCDGATGQVGHGRDGRDLAPTNAAMPTSSLVRVIATAAAASVRWCGLVAPTIGANTTGLAKRPDQRDRWAITSAPGGRGDTTDQLRTTTAALSAPRRLTMDNSDKWFRLDNHGHPILGSRGRRVQISPARHVRPVRGHLASSVHLSSAFHENFT